MPVDPRHYKELYELFASVESVKEAQMLLEDILTPQELESLAERWQLVQELDSGKPQRSIADHLHVSICKITRGSRQMQYGSGGFQHFLKKLKKSRK